VLCDTTTDVSYVAFLLSTKIHSDLTAVLGIYLALSFRLFLSSMHSVEAYTENIKIWHNDNNNDDNNNIKNDDIHDDKKRTIIR